MINELFNNNAIFKGGLMLSILTGMFLFLKEKIPIFQSFIMRKISTSLYLENKDLIYELFNNWLFENYPEKFKSIIVTTKFIEIDDDGNSPEKNKLREENDKFKNSHYEYVESNYFSTFTIWFKGYPVIITTNREKFEAAQQMYLMHIDSYKIITFFNKNLMKELMKELLNQYSIKNKLQKNVLLYDFRPNYWEKINSINSKKFEQIFNDEKHILLNDIIKFQNNKDFYAKRGLKYKRAFLLEGPPGNGKTSTILSIAQKLKMNLYNLNLGAIREDYSLKCAFNAVPGNSILLMEDVDAVMNGRKINEDDKFNSLNFNTLLNIIDGVFSKENIIIIFTTNHIEKLDSALLRHGRIDNIIKFNNPTKQNIIELLQVFYEIEDIPDFVYNPSYPACTVQEMAISNHSLANFLWNYEHPKKLKIIKN